MIVTTGGRGTPSVATPSSPAASIGNFFLRLFFKADHIGVGSEEARHLTGQFGIEGLINRGEDSASQQARDQIFGADFELLRQILDADSFSNRDAARDRLRLIGKRQPRRRHEALHRAFLHTARNIALPRPARGRARPAAGTSRARRRQSWSNPSGRVPVGDWRVGCIGRRSPGRSGGCGRPGAARTRTLKNWLAGYRPSGSRTRRCSTAHPERSAQPASVAPCRPDAGRFEGRSCAAAAFAAGAWRSECVPRWRLNLGRRLRRPEACIAAGRHGCVGGAATGAAAAGAAWSGIAGGGNSGRSWTTGGDGAENVGLGVDSGTMNSGWTAQARRFRGSWRGGLGGCSRREPACAPLVEAAQLPDASGGAAAAGLLLADDGIQNIAGLAKYGRDRSWF